MPENRIVRTGTDSQSFVKTWEDQREDSAKVYNYRPKTYIEIRTGTNFCLFPALLTVIIS